mmetsp:Transcript_13249/g.25383  ORF Transcript_13249/g.25383 Transcript_13249/m.25383 type:complete len:465 (+) Transcript_13249:147-1541(+)|eukprot:CAMPEP_0114253336 /NCGR_PEP_ID=MMETSP0058-20121206/16332_1 /TAXON_ID=36894 /ORGANISM="Pyramimonas parkeae, CCMP726" /LENGTH=464 /DNA_ID=CAMNT_0001367363 /DNA_START=117 /DNA_END=1511 /DNA_ORIENTATION=+
MVDDDELVQEEPQEPQEGAEEGAEEDEDAERKRHELARKIFGDSDDEGDGAGAGAEGKSDDDALVTEEAARKSKKERKREKKEKKRARKELEKGEKRKRDKEDQPARGSSKKSKAPERGGGDKLFDAMGARGSDEEGGFIDDTGVAEEDRDDRDSDADSVDAPEAMEDGEADEFDKMFEYKANRRRKSNISHAETKSFVEAFLGKMELAADQDVEANQMSRPAIHKLQMLAEVQEVLEKTHLHEDLLEAGLLNILKLWLEPLSDGSIPNVNVRTTLLGLLKKLPVNVEMFDRREQLKKSGLGKIVMFLYKFPEETLQNKRTAQALVEMWSRPIFELSTRWSDLKRMEQRDDAEEAHPHREGKQKQRQERFADQDMERVKADGIKPGEAGYRNHATIPEPSKMDFTRRPESRVQVEGSVKARNFKPLDGKTGKIDKRMIALKYKGRKKDIHAMKVSVEGRGVAHL